MALLYFAVFRTFLNLLNYITDLGMTGVIESIIGMDIKMGLERVKTQVLYRMACAEGRGLFKALLRRLIVKREKRFQLKESPEGFECAFRNKRIALLFILCINYLQKDSIRQNPRLKLPIPSKLCSMPLPSRLPVA